MKKRTRKLFSLVALVLILCMSVSVPVFAASDSNEEDTAVFELISNPVITSVGNTIDSGGDITSGYYCEITLHMDRAYFEPYFRAGATGNSNNMVNCTITLPSGQTHDLGSVCANGSTTPYLHYTGTAPAGDYIFKFQGTDGGLTGFVAFMYSNY